MPRDLLVGVFILHAASLAACGNGSSASPGPLDSGGARDGTEGVVDGSPEANDAQEAGADDGGPATCNQTGDAGAAVMVASGQSHPSGIAVDRTSIYWANSGSGTIVKCPLAGCNGSPTVLASAQSRPFIVLVDHASVYWTNLSAGIQKCPLDGCGSNPPTVFAPGKTAAAGIALDAANVYWTETRTGIVASCPLAGCADPHVLYAGPAGAIYGLLVDPMNVYWVNNYNGQVSSAPLSGVPDGGSPTLIAQAIGGEAFAAMDSTRIYWTENTDPGGVLDAPLAGLPDGGTPATFAAGLHHPQGIIVDRTCGTVYWATSGVADATQDAGSAIYRCPVTGCTNTPTVVEGNQGGSTSVTQDGDTIYWSNFDDGTVWKKHK